MFNIEGFINYKREFMVGMRVNPASYFSYVLTRSEAEKLVADLTRALSSSDRQVEADSEETSYKSSCCDGECHGIRSRCELQGEADADFRDDPWL